MGFAVLHIEKGTAGKAGGLGSHIDRTKKVLNADPKLSEKNLFYHLGENGKVYVYDNFKNRRSLQERINRRIQEGYKGKTAIRKDAVTHLNVVLTGSHEEMTAIGENPERLTQWMNENYRFVSERVRGEKRCGLHPTYGRADTAHSLCRCAVNRGRQTFRQRGHG